MALGGLTLAEVEERFSGRYFLVLRITAGWAVIPPPVSSRQPDDQNRYNYTFVKKHLHNKSLEGSLNIGHFHWIGERWTLTLFSPKRI